MDKLANEYISLKRGWTAVLTATSAVAAMVLGLILGLGRVAEPAEHGTADAYRVLVVGVASASILLGVATVWLRRPVVAIEWPRREVRFKYYGEHIVVSFGDIVSIEQGAFPCTFVCIVCLHEGRLVKVCLYLYLLPCPQKSAMIAKHLQAT